MRECERTDRHRHGQSNLHEEPAPRLEGFEFEAPAERDCMGSLRAPIAIMVPHLKCRFYHYFGLLSLLIGRNNFAVFSHELPVAPGDRGTCSILESYIMLYLS